MIPVNLRKAGREHRLGNAFGLVPPSGDIGIGISILSYNGGVQFGIVGDDAIAADPDQIIRRLAPEFEKLVLLAANPLSYSLMMGVFSKPQDI